MLVKITSKYIEFEMELGDLDDPFFHGIILLE